MGLVIQAKLVCDKDGSTEHVLGAVDDPTPDGWLKDQGYANVGGGVQAALVGYYCPGCIASFGTRALVKQTADLCGDLTGTP